MIRRSLLTVAASLTALALLAVPAFAGSSFTVGAEAPADADHLLELTITEPEDEAYGDTAQVTIVAPPEFTVVSCQQEPTWDCTADPATGRVIFDRTVLGVVGDATLQFTVHTPKINGTYTFSVTQADGAEEPATVRSAPTVTVTGGTDPEPPQDDGDTTDDGTTDDGTSGGGDDGTTTDDGTTGDGTTDDGTTDDGSTTDDGTSGGGDDGSSTGDGTTGDEATSTDDTSSGTADDSDDDGTSDSGGSTTPRRTEGRSDGALLEITPRQTGTDDPDVADEPAIAPPTDDDVGEQDTDGEPSTMTAIAGQPDDEREEAGGLPWQQLLGGALLVAGGAVVAMRRWDVLARVRGWDPLGRIRRWRS